MGEKATVRKTAGAYPPCHESMSHTPTLRSSAASPTLLGSLMLRGKAKSVQGPVPRGVGSLSLLQGRAKNEAGNQVQSLAQSRAKEVRAQPAAGL